MSNQAPTTCWCVEEEQSRKCCMKERGGKLAESLRLMQNHAEKKVYPLETKNKILFLQLSKFFWLG